MRISKKKSGAITLTILAGVSLSACRREVPRDPCDSTSFAQDACEQAVKNNGYYYRGSWVPMFYSHPYPYYYDSYNSYVSRGGRVSPAPAGAYAGKSSSGVTRGGFGSTGASGHAGGE